MYLFDKEMIEQEKVQYVTAFAGERTDYYRFKPDPKAPNRNTNITLNGLPIYQSHELGSIQIRYVCQ